MNDRKKILISLFLVLIILPVYAEAAKGVLSDDAQMCMGCHSDKGLTKQLENKEILSLFINGNEFANSVHNPMGCTGCHMDISMENHPQVMTIKSKQEWALKASKSCTMCHADAQIKKKPIHSYLITKAKAPTCAECHGLHAIKRISDWKPQVNVNQYCLTCHKQELSISIKGIPMRLHIDESLLKGSVHNKHACSDCHSEFSKEQHPVKTLEDIRGHSIAVSDVCRRCHSDKFALVEGGIHFIMLKGGNLKAPVCTDCHGFHSVGPKETYKTLTGVPCKKCHENIFNAYKESVHGKAKIKGVEKAPICSSCHKAHDVKVTAMTEQMKGACLGCHKEAESLHKEWLWSAPFALPTLAKLHLDTIACAACHSPVAARGIYLRLYDKNTGKPFTDEQIKKLLGTEPDEFMKRMDSYGDGIDSSELWEIFKQLNKKGAEASVVFQGRMDVQKDIESHQLALKKEAVRECARCHSAESEFFKDVKVAIIKADGRPAFYSAKQEVLGSLFSVLSLNQFYALGGTRLKLLDILFILAVLGGLSVPVAHITARILTIPIRSLKKMGKGGKR
ncbi:MAG: hypothetical protein HZA07_01425 [Nitrospirae bacterium]|nr:hypothetical protein [Nitrospirota bacterium]